MSDHAAALSAQKLRCRIFTSRAKRLFSKHPLQLHGRRDAHSPPGAAKRLFPQPKFERAPHDGAH
jgi:hypothetical protein